MFLIVAVPYVVWRVADVDYYAPLVVVQIIAGIFLGPGVIGAAYPEYYTFVFTAPVVQSLNGIAWWGVMLFVMLAGIELDLAKAWEERRECAVTAGLALGTPFALGCIVAAILIIYPGWVGPKAESWQFVFSIGMACAVTSLPILILLMEKLDILRQPLGRRILRYASLDDILIWGVLALILLDVERIGREAGFIVAFTVLALGFRKMMVKLDEEDRWYVALIWLAAVSFAADWAGLHFMVRAFLSGAVMDANWFNQEKLDLLRQHVLLTLMPVYFLSTGLRTNWAIGGWAIFVAGAALLLASVAGKLLGMQIAGKIFKWKPGEASLIGWMLQTKALIGIVFANILLDKGVITSETFTAMLLMAIGSTMLTTPVVYPKIQRIKASIVNTPVPNCGETSASS